MAEIHPDAQRLERCPMCDRPIAKLYNLFEREELFLQTPKAVWDEYRENGYPLHRAISMEFSYA